MSAADREASDRAELEKLFTDSEATPEEAKKICAALQRKKNIKSVKIFYQYFQTWGLQEWHTQCNTEEMDWENNGPLWCHVDAAWKKLKKIRGYMVERKRVTWDLMW